MDSPNGCRWGIPQFPQPRLIQPLVVELAHDNIKLFECFPDAGDPPISHLVVRVAKGKAIAPCLLYCHVSRVRRAALVSGVYNTEIRQSGLETLGNLSRVIR